jgi:catechol 2,3-dioxygenase-like lactoylglutathione lyase family enzyme
LKVLGLDHVQLAMPADEEERARAFYGGVLGLEELPKPEPLASRGGVWFRCGDRELHLGVEAQFLPAKKAHPALRVEGFAELCAALRQCGCPVRDDDALRGVTRAFTEDPFGNRIELIAAEGG